MALRRHIRGAFVALSLATLACATYSERTEAARAAMQRGDVSSGVKELNRFLKVRKSDDLPSKWKKDFELVVLERATMLQALGLYQLSSRDFEVADKRLELLDIARDGAGKLGKYVYSDSATKYKTSPTEKLSLNAMNICNYLVRGDLSGAKVEAKRFTVMRNYMRDYDPEHEHGAFGSYLAGFVYEQLGEADEALRYYDEALQERELATLRGPIEALSRRGSYRGDRIKDYLPPGGAAPSNPPAEPATTTAPPAGDAPTSDKSDGPPVQKPGATPPVAEFGGLSARAPWSASAPAEGEVLVIAKTGRVPFKLPRRIPIGAAIGLAGAFITGDTTILEYGMFKVVTYPELVPHETVFDSAELKLDGHAFAMDLASELTGELVREYEDIKPKIIGAAITRMIARAAVAEAGRAAGNQAQENGNLIGFLAAAALEGTMVALDRPDTRSWTTLPAKVFVARARVPAGKHSIDVIVRGPGGWERRTTEVDVPAGGFAVVDVTTLR
ncbi:MAG: hypothetical protein IAG13_27610, partial [Deltaproteobacteria bacterium]|nr:hypothetical protein [Nannocystaceae bacterium]